MTKIVVAFFICFLALLQVQSSWQKLPEGVTAIKGTRSEKEGREYLQNTTEKTSGRIFFGLPATDGQFPYYVLLLLYGALLPFTCGGTLLSPSWTLTAAQCFPVPTVTEVQLFAGSANRLAMPVFAHGQGYAKHPKYTLLPLENDVGLLLHATAIFPSATVGYLGLPSVFIGNTCPFTLSGLVTMGFGITPLDLAPSYLSYVSLTTTNQISCWLTDLQPFDFTKFCAKNLLGGSICLGDSGGPAVLTSFIGSGTLIGVASFPMPLVCLPNPTSVFTRVASYNDWIASYTGSQIKWF